MLRVTKEGVAKRDSFVFNQANNRRIPIVMMLSGSYAKDCVEVISNSLINIITSE